MTHKLTVERYMDAFTRTDHAQVLSCLTDDVEWKIPGAFHARGKDAFDAHIESPDFLPNPDIRVTRLIEEDDTVVAEGTVQTRKIDGTALHLAFCDVFEMKDGRIRRLISYLMPTS